MCFSLCLCILFECLKLLECLAVLLCSLTIQFLLVKQVYVTKIYGCFEHSSLKCMFCPWYGLCSRCNINAFITPKRNNKTNKTKKKREKDQSPCERDAIIQIEMDCLLSKTILFVTWYLLLLGFTPFQRYFIGVRATSHPVYPRGRIKHSCFAGNWQVLYLKQRWVTFSLEERDLPQPYLEKTW